MGELPETLSRGKKPQRSGHREKNLVVEGGTPLKRDKEIRERGRGGTISKGITMKNTEMNNIIVEKWSGSRRRPKWLGDPIMMPLMWYKIKKGIKF